MSIQLIQNRLASIQRESERLQRQLVDETKKEANKHNEKNRITSSISKNTSMSMLQTKQRRITSLENEIGRIQKKKADLTSKIAKNNSELHKNQQDLYKAQNREQKKFQEDLLRKQRETASRGLGFIRTSTLERTQNKTKLIEYDVFISHASEDKDEIARPLAEALRALNFSVWFDEFELKLGDSLRRSIERGLNESRFGIVILSHNFLSKEWPQKELDGLFARESDGSKVILPIWHNISKQEVMSYSPILSDKFAMSTANYTIEELAKEIAKILKAT